jgi:hypothetical protein
MRRQFFVVALVGALSVAGASLASAQDQDSFKVTTTDVGPVIGVGGLSGAGAGFGGRFEKAFMELPNLANGILGIGVSVDYWSFSTSFSNIVGFDYKVIPVAVTVNYHYPITDHKNIDPFFGAGLGYEHFSVSGPSCTFAGVNVCDASYSSGVYFVGHAGIRYYFKPKMALFADVGSGTGAFHAGLMFKLAD